ncbi:hypothetical protein ABGT15_04350 [Flavobacterium enshiense]|uniref:hypothetical protein n=1 Tax=Flavobacterium enshiense TaxID=1341165 RepID=UPI00345D65B0
MKEKFKEFLQRDFDFNDTLKVLKSPINVFWSWGVEKIYTVENSGIILKVNGHHWKHFVLITLAWNDTYTVTLLDGGFNPTKTMKEIYFDELQNRIDKEIEFISDYEGV